MLDYIALMLFRWLLQIHHYSYLEKLEIYLHLKVFWNQDKLMNLAKNQLGLISPNSLNIRTANITLN